MSVPGYHFGSSKFQESFVKLPNPSTSDLRKAALDYLKNFDAKTWHDDPQRTILMGKPVKTPQDTEAPTTDAFSNKNGLAVLSGPDGVDKVLAHLKAFKPGRDYRAKARAIEDDLLNNYAGFLIGNQALDFKKQDGVTEVFEWWQACQVERLLADQLFEDEEKGNIEIHRDPSFVGCVSNFSNFLDLSRKVLRHIELGVPVLVLSRSNTSQHCYRWFQVLTELMKKHELDLGLATFLCAALPEQQRVMKELPDSPFYVTGNRKTAASIKKLSKNLMSSTGGPNTMVCTELSPEFAEAASMSTMIENSGQCTAMRHMALAGPAADVKDVAAFMQKNAKQVASSADALEGEMFSALFEKTPFTLEDSYTKVEGLPIAVRVNNELPKEIDEHWRESYLDVTSGFDWSKDGDVKKLCDWLNHHQPISLAVNGKEAPYKLMRSLFEGSSLVVYTIGSQKHPSLTAQARPQEGEVFGEFPPRHELKKYTKFPMVVPSSGPAYHSTYSASFLKSKAAEAWPIKSCEALASKIDSVAHRGYAQVVAEYLLDATKENPKQGGAEWGVSRTVLYGLQRPPIGTKSVLRGDDMNTLATNLLPFLATNATKKDGDISVSTKSQAIADVLSGLGVDCRVESDADFEKWVGANSPWNVVHCKNADQDEFSLAAQFVSVLFPLGHIKSTIPADEEFLQELKASEKWLQCE